MFLLYIIILLLLIAALYLFAIMPGKVLAPKELDGLRKNTTFAHRGSFDNKTIYENSLDAFRIAKERGFGIELDVKLTKDDKVVIFHDDTLERLCGITGRVCDYTYEELSQYKLGDSNECIPLFSDVLKLLDGMVPMIVEYKPDTDPLRLCVLTDKLLRTYSGPYVIESFDYKVLAWYKKNNPSVIRGLLVSKRFSNLTEISTSLLLINVLARPHFVACKYTVRNRMSLFLYKHLFHGMLAGWTFKDKETLAKHQSFFDFFLYDLPL